MACKGEATFTLNPSEQADDAKVRAKAELAVKDSQKGVQELRQESQRTVQ